MSPALRAVALASTWWTLALIAAGAVAAQDAGAAPATPALVAPRLREFVPSPHPIGFEDLEAEVILDITVSVDGTVTEVTVVTPAGDGFDELAVAAARRFVFDPATRDGTPVAARVRYRYVFEVHEEVHEVEVDDAGQGESGDDGELPAEGDAEGDAAADDAPPEDAPDDELPVFSARARAEPPPRETTRRTLTREVLTSIPGTRGDALRAVELLPGVGRPAFGAGVLIVRGAAPGDSQVFLDGNPVPLLYHFGGLTSFFNSTLLERMDFIPGNFGVRYGRKIGGILEVEPRDPRTDGHHGYIDVNAIDASILFEGPIDPHFSIALSFRRSYIDAFFGAIVGNSDGFVALTAPVYYDYQALATWTPTPDDRVRAFVYGSSDELRFFLNDPGDGDPAVRGNLGISTQFHRVQLSWRHLFTPWLEQDLSLGVGLNILQFGLGDVLRLESEFWPINGRAEWRARLAPNVRVIGGLDIQATPLSLQFRGPPQRQSEGDPGGMMLSGSRPVDYRVGGVVAYRPAAYVESSVTLFDLWDLNVGVRADFYREIQAWTIDPRLTTRVRLTDTTNVRAGVGLFSQPPEFNETAGGIGNRALEPLHALHVGLGVDQRIPDYALSFTLDGFYKHIWDRVVGTANGTSPFFENGGLGRIYGMEVGARLEPGGPIPLFGFVSYTLMRSERLDRPGDDWRLFDFDQTHILTAALVARWGRGFELGATFRLVSGNPYTPVVSSLYDVRTGLYQPIYGPVNSDRNPFFHRLDVRFAKRWQIDDVGIQFYVDIQNVYNATNREGTLYNYDYSQIGDIPGLPIIPSIGLRGDL